MDSLPPAFQTVDLGVRYRVARHQTVAALDSVNLVVGRGEVVSVVGSSGCGKSTLLNTIAGLQEPWTGRVLVGGQEPSSRLGMFSYLPQRDLLLPWLRSIDNAGLLLEIEGASRSEARARARAMLERFGLERFASYRPERLSGGMRQRVGLIRTFLLDRDVLLDEPFASLDAMTRGELQEWLLGLQAASRRSMLLVTHDLDEAILLSDRLYLMTPRPGRIMEEMVVPLAKPRTLEVTGTPDFAEMKAKMLAILRTSRAPGRAA
ncbi:MAG TPA: ABC transporter ATP-binding protein [Chloroflexota bacterium]|nr:ABC transporter ATP-binding protein [Chloroflexota bacterium]